MLLLSSVQAAVALLYGVTAVVGLDTAGSIAAAAGANQCGVVQGIVNNLPSTAVSSAQAFCNVYLKASLQTVTVPGPTSTVRVAGICAAPSVPPQASKRDVDLGKRGFVRSPAAPCPTFLTALGTSMISKACSCLTQTATTVTASLSVVTLTTYTPVLVTTTTTFTVTPAASIAYATAVSSRVLTSTTTSVVSATSVKQDVISSTAYSTSTFLSVATVVVPSPISTSTATYSTVVTSTETVLTTIVVVATSRVLQKRAPSSVLTGCSTSTITVSKTVTAPRPTSTVILQSVNDQTTQQVALSTTTTTVTSTQVTTVTLPTTITVPTTSTSISGFVAPASTLVTSSTTSTQTVASTTTTTVLRPLMTNLVQNPSFEESWSYMTPWDSNSCFIPSDTTLAADGQICIGMEFIQGLVWVGPATLFQQIVSPLLAIGGRVKFQYSWGGFYADSGVGTLTCSFSASWNGLAGFQDAITIQDPSNPVYPSGYKVGNFDIPPSTETAGELAFMFACTSPGSGTSNIDAILYVDNVSLNVTNP
ncbi:hypothetical protein PYCC9005_005406 [Savitreella phatthalungensis]